MQSPGDLSHPTKAKTWQPAWARSSAQILLPERRRWQTPAMQFLLESSVAANNIH
jgi:hypothetical protein